MTTVRVRGGGTLPIGSGRLHLTWPFLALELTEAGVCMRIEPSWVRRLGLSLGGVDSPDGGKGLETWFCSWDGLDQALLALRKVVFCPHQGRRCRFVTVRRRSAKRIATALAVRGAAMRTISRFSSTGFSD
jgi:hypothetical protein